MNSSQYKTDSQNFIYRNEVRTVQCLTKKHIAELTCSSKSVHSGGLLTAGSFPLIIPTLPLASGRYPHVTCPSPSCIDLRHETSCCRKHCAQVHPFQPLVNFSGKY